MRYWDSSALVPLVVAEDGSSRVRDLLREDGHIVTWAWTRVEIASAVERRSRTGDLSREARRLVLDRFAELAATWDEVTDVLPVRKRALGVLARHPLRAADAAQLAAALVVADEGVEGLAFVCLDDRLLDAAEREGLRPLPT